MREWIFRETGEVRIPKEGEYYIREIVHGQRKNSSL